MMLHSLKNNSLTANDSARTVSEFWQQWLEHRDVLYQCCLKMMNFNQTDAEDALSRACIKAWEKVQKFAGKIGSLKNWLFKLTSNLCIDIIRERSRGAWAVESIEWVADTEAISTAKVEEPELALETEEKYNEIGRAIADLPQTLGDTFVLHFYQELTHKEIAERQGISYDNVCRRIYKARKQLKEKLSGYFRGTQQEVTATVSAGRKSPTPREYGERDLCTSSSCSTRNGHQMLGVESDATICLSPMVEAETDRCDRSPVRPKELVPLREIQNSKFKMLLYPERLQESWSIISVALHGQKIADVANVIALGANNRQQAIGNREPKSLSNKGLSRYLLPRDCDYREVLRDLLRSLKQPVLLLSSILNRALTEIGDFWRSLLWEISKPIGSCRGSPPVADPSRII